MLLMALLLQNPIHYLAEEKPGVLPPKSTLIDEEHHPSKMERVRADNRVSDLTQNVAARLPGIGSEQRKMLRRNLIDDHLFGAMEKDSIPHAPLSNDFEFCRRVYLDLTGRIPTRDQLLEFTGNRAANKRDLLIDKLLESQAWVDRWAYWFGDQFRNCANRSGEPALVLFDNWVRQSLREDKPYSRFVTEMLVASAPSTNWVFDAAPSAYLARWHVLGDTVTSDMFEDTADEIVVNVGRNFLGINYQCVSCHDGAGHLEKLNVDLTQKKRRDFWAMAAFFGQMRMRKVIYQDRFTIMEDGRGYNASAPSTVRIQRAGGDVVPTFILTGEKADTSQPLRPQFARMLTAHPQFARATVNLFWKEFFGLGIVDPVDAFDMARIDPKTPLPEGWTLQPTNLALLEGLARDFVANRYSLKHLMRTITRSSAYQLSSKFDGEWKASFTPHFARKYVRMLWAEEVHDNISQATQVFGDYKRPEMLPGRTETPPVRFFTELASPEELQGKAAGPIKFFLQTFGQSNREQFDRQSVGSILQAMLLMNDDFVSRRVKAENGSLVEQLLKSGQTDAEIVEQLYLATLSRFPLAEEKQLSLALLSKDRVQGAEDLHWGLINKLDFLFNY